VRLLLTGASGQLGAYLLRELTAAGAEVTAWSGARRGELFGTPLQPVDLADAGAVAAAFRQARPGAVLHAAALASVAECHRDPERAFRVNVGGTATLAELAAGAGVRFVLVSTDLVFDGEHAPYREADPPAPLSAYGRSKAEAEAAALAAPRAAVARVSLLFGRALAGRPSFFDQQADALRAGRPVTLFADEWRTPLHLATAARALVALASSDFTGVLHVGGPERLSRLEMGQRLAHFLRADPGVIVAARRADAPAEEPRPRDVALDSSRWRGLFPALPWPTWEEALRGEDGDLVHPAAGAPAGPQPRRGGSE
jgi:dTDP-4-dehydrorhamnose reductase